MGIPKHQANKTKWEHHVDMQRATEYLHEQQTNNVKLGSLQSDPGPHSESSPAETKVPLGFLI